MKESIEQDTVNVKLTAEEIEHTLLALSCFDSEVDEYFHMTIKLHLALATLEKRNLDTP